tara:strand:- start:72 stop:674 length:603 start_codon:yes stop_codon:yes gene_type:complete
MSNALNSVATQSPSAKDVKDNTLKASNPKAVATGKAVAKLEIKHSGDRFKMFERLYDEIKGFKNDYKGYSNFRSAFSIAYSDAKGVQRDSGRKTFDRWLKDMVAYTTPNKAKPFKFEAPERPIKPESEVKKEKRAEAKAEDADGSQAKADEQTMAMALYRETRQKIADALMAHGKACDKNKIAPNQSALDKMLAIAQKLS